ncbi:MAG: hypothetical protein CBC62_03485 [Opitutia bacterium TMED102]|nr:hypothetical protein [Verrucomicrobiales bacterium]OUV41598.1 MAG: hypothetical protein CBC62_03485 [Opitutae bacterium TMED102]
MTEKKNSFTNWRARGGSARLIKRIMKVILFQGSTVSLQIQPIIGHVVFVSPCFAEPRVFNKLNP